MTQKTVMIFGVSSFVGSNLAEFFKRDYKVVGTYYSSPVFIPGVLTVPCDVLAKEEVQLAMFAFKPDITIYAVGLSSVYDCSQSEAIADALNTMGLFNVSEYCQRYKSQLCYLSSAFVMRGEKKKYVEMDIPDANNVYGKTKASAEFYIQKTSLNYVIFRCSLLYGRSINPMQLTWFEKMQQKLKKGEGFAADNSVHTGFLDVIYLAMTIKICFEKGLTNRLLQVGSTDEMTMFQFMQKYCEVFNEPVAMISKGRWPFPTIAVSAANLEDYDEDELHYHLDIANLENYFNLKMPTIEESLAFSYKRFHGVQSTKKDRSDGGSIAYI